MELAGRLQRADEIIDEAELHVVLEHNHEDSEKQHREGNRGNGKGGSERPEPGARRAATRGGGRSNLRKKGDRGDGARSGGLLGRRRCRAE
jgi:hypothetical protein